MRTSATIAAILLSTAVASATTDLEAFQKAVSKYLSPLEAGAKKGFCICDSDTGGMFGEKRVGVIQGGGTVIQGGATFAVLTCFLADFNPDGSFKVASPVGCTNWTALSK